MDLGLSNRVVLVTGGSRGIGRAAAEAFATEGAQVVLTYRHNRDEAAAVAQGIERRGGVARVAALDLADPGSIQRAVADTLDACGRIDVLVNNALAAPAAPSWSVTFDDAAPECWRPWIRANIEGTYATTQSVLGGMRQRRWGRIVNVSSVWATDGMPGFGWYATAKSALHGLTRSLAKEFGPAGVLVNVVMPGLTLTERVRREFPEAAQARQARRLPIRRLPSPEDVASVVVFLASAANATITGEVVRVSGG